MTPEETQELEYLRYFYGATDFGPAHEDVVDLINEAYEGVIPPRYKPEEYDD